MDHDIGQQFNSIESIVYESLLKKKDTIIKHSKPLEVDNSVRSFTVHKDDDKAWHNWAGNVVFEPQKILYPKTVEEIKGVVKDAQKNGKKIRCAAQGHSWSTLSVTNDYLVVLNKMDKVDVEKTSDGWVAHVEAGALISHIDEVLRNHNPPLTITSMTVLDTIRMGGVVAPGCHGAATETRTIVDQVVGFQIVTADGELREFSNTINREEMEAARVCLGLLGIIYRVSIHVEPMYKLRMIDEHPLIKDLNASMLKNYVKNSDGIELFYWPFNSSSKDKDRLWLKRWEKSIDAATHDDALERTFHHTSQDVTTKIADTLYQELLDDPEKTPVITNLAGKLKLINRDQVWEAPDAIHYQAGIDNIPCEDLEFAIKVDEDFGNVITELRHVIDRIYELKKENKYPINLVAELRILKSSSATLSMAYDEDPNSYYFFLEVLSIRGTKGFREFSAELAQRWMDKYKARPHWAKHWEYVPNIHAYLHDLIGDRIKKFEVVRSKYDPNNLFFDNESLRRVFYGN